jgi:hypothetical protein
LLNFWASAILLSAFSELAHSGATATKGCHVPINKAALTTAILLTICSAGCGRTYHPVNVAVYDAETDAPIAGAEVAVYYRGIYPFGFPKSDPAATDDRGAATIRIAAGETVEWCASAEGYMVDRGEPGEDVRVFRLYKLPRPQVTIVVPNGYRGPLKIDMRLVPGRVQGKIGKRDFVFRASPSGYVDFDATPLLLATEHFHSLESNFFAVHEDGSPVPDDYRLGRFGVGLRWVADGGLPRRWRRLYVIGTYADGQALHAKIMREIDGDPHHLMMDDDALDALFTQPQAVPKQSSGR